MLACRMCACLLLLLCVLPVWALAQVSQLTGVQETSYVFPIRPGQTNHLSSGHAELRGTHFHTALDIRTQQRKGLPVYATAEGYVSRIKIERLGYGRAIYVQHLNGYTSVYAHVESFSDEIERWTLEQQYTQRAFTVDLRPKPWQFPVQAGEVIALSGNTGGSTGPHLHFEIRDEEQRALDPLRTGKFKEIVDTYPPTFLRLALRTIDTHARISGQFGRFEFLVHAQRGRYRLLEKLQLQGCIGVELMARDVYARGKSDYGLPEVRLSLDEEERFAQYIEAIDFSKQRHIAVHMNYAANILQQRRYSKLYVDDGNELPFYSTDERRGMLCFEEGMQLQSLLLQGWDASGNESRLQLVLNAGRSSKLQASFDTKQPQGYFVQDNTLLLYFLSENKAEQLRLLLVDGSKPKIHAAYAYAAYNVYLWDLRKGVPRRVYLVAPSNRTELLLSLDLQAHIPSGEPYRFENAHMRLDFSPHSLYDTLYLRFKKESRKDYASETFYFKNEDHPLRSSIRFALKPEESYLWSKTSAYRIDRDEAVFHPTTWQEGEARFESKAFGPFVLLTDTIAPRLLRVRKSKGKLRFYVSDDISGLHSWEATIDGEWVLMEYTQKKGFLRPRPRPGEILPKGTLRLSLRDNQNNTQAYTYALTP